VLSWTTVPRTPSTATGAVVTGLTNGIEYIFRITAINPVGSGQAATTRATPMTIPSAPVIVSATPGDSRVSLAWNAPASDGGGAIANYLVEYKVNTPTAAWVRFPRSASSATSATVQPLINGTSYLFRVSGINAAGTGPASVASEPATPVTAPSAATGLVAVGGDKSATLTWTAPLSNGGLPISDYIVEYRQLTNATWNVFADGTSANTTATVTGLVNGQTYAFRVTAKNSFGTGTPSAESNAATALGLAAAPTAPVPTAGNGVVHLAWNAPSDTGGATINDYLVQYRKTSDAGWTTYSHAPSAAAGILVNGLTPGFIYVFRVAAITVVGTGTTSAESSAIGLTASPSAPTAVVATAGDKRANLSWTAPAFINGSLITDYVIEYRKTSDPAWTVFADGVSVATTAVGTGLKKGVPYTFRVTAKNSIGASLPSGEASVVTPMGLPAVPTNVTGVGRGGTVALNWTPPTDTGGMPILGYVVQYRVNMDGQQWVTATWPTNVSPTASNITLGGFVTRYGHLFRVAAKTALGQGAWSVESLPINPWAA